MNKISMFKIMLALMSNEKGHLHLFGPRILLDPNKGEAGGGTGGNAGQQGGGQGNTPNHEELLAQANRQIQRLQSQIGRLTGGKKGGQGRGRGHDDDLRTKVSKERETERTKQESARAIEDILTFNLTIDNYVKENEEVLPEEFAEILRIAEKESYDSAADKANAIKASFIQAFFSVEKNVELLTKSQRSQLDDYLKLTKNGREAAAPSLYLNLFEPTIEMVKRLKKAEELELSRSGLHAGSKSGDAYRDRLIELGKKRFKLKE